MNKVVIIFAVLLTAVYVASAQNLDPTVEVTRGYKVEMVDVHKPGMEMSVPDSVYRFDLDFDYSVFAKTYGGSYEFNPYSIDMKPQGLNNLPTVLYVNAGAGYTLHPTLDVVYSPISDGKFKIDVYGNHRSYFGDYRMPHLGKIPAGKAFSGGYDLESGASADLSYDWDNAVVDLGLSYYGLAVRDYMHKDDYNAFDAKLSVRSKSLWSRKYMYDISAAYRLGGDSQVREHIVGFDMKFGPALNARHKVFMDLGGRFVSCEKTSSAAFGSGYILPHYLYQWDWFKADLGARVAFVASGNKLFLPKNQFVYPDVHLSCIVAKNVMKIYLDVTGGETLNTYSSLLEKNHHFHVAYQTSVALLTASLVRVRPELGIEGRITNFFTYDLKGGYVCNASSPVDALVELPYGRYAPALGYADNQQLYLGLDWDLSFKSFRFDGSLKYTDTWNMESAPENVYYVLPSRWTADVCAVYNWNKRLYFGVDSVIASNAYTSKKGMFVPYYVDLGAFAEYVINKNFSVWLRGGNLLDMEIQRNLFFAEKGVNFTAGICWKLQ